MVLSAANRFYATADGWIRVQAPSLFSLLRALCLEGSDGGGQDLLRRVSDALAATTVSEAIAQLTSAGIPAVAARHPAELWQDSDLRLANVFCEQQLADGSPFFAVHRYARFSRTEERAAFTAPGIGEHSSEVLAEAGLSSAEINALIEKEVVRQGSPCN